MNIEYAVNPLLSKVGENFIQRIIFYNFSSSPKAKAFNISYTTSNGTKMNTYIYEREQDGNTKLKLPIEISQTSPDSYTLKLINIPKLPPVESGIVWNDNGTLKITP